jgi:glycine oxidase
VKPAGSSLPEASIAVVGGGIIGMAVAWQLARPQQPGGNAWRVAVFEKNSVGGEASWAGAGMLSPGGEIEGPSPFAELAIESREMYGDFVKQLEEASGFAIDYQQCGAVNVAYGREDLQMLETQATIQAGAGIESKRLSPAQVATFWPRLRNEGLAGGRFYPKDAIVNPREVMLALAAACRKLNTAIVQNCAVTRTEVEADGVRVYAGGQSAKYKAAVIAAGAWSNDIVVSGVPPIPKAVPVKGHLIGYQQPEQTCSTIVRHGQMYLLQRANGLLIVGSSMEQVGFDRTLRPEIIEMLREQAGFLFPHLSDTLPTESWIGFRPQSDAIHMEAWHSERLYLAYGHYRNGILLAPVTAKRIGGIINANLRTH